MRICHQENWRYVDKSKRQAVIFKQKVKTHNNEHFDDHFILNFGSQLPYCFEKKNFSRVNIKQNTENIFKLSGLYPNSCVQKHR